MNMEKFNELMQSTKPVLVAVMCCAFQWILDYNESIEMVINNLQIFNNSFNI